MKKNWVMSLVVAMTVFMTAAAGAAPVQWAAGVGGNDHWYEAVYVDGGITWTNANAAAAAAGGYLATATSSAENTFIFNLIDFSQFWFIDGADNNQGPWLGAYYDGPSGSMDTTNWKWVSGEAWGYSNWDDWEPNFPEERWAQFFSNDASSGNPIRQAFWNNISDSPDVRGYIIEWDANPVPLPGAVWLLGSGLAGLAGLRRRFRR